MADANSEDSGSSNTEPTANNTGHIRAALSTCLPAWDGGTKLQWRMQTQKIVVPVTLNLPQIIQVEMH